MSRTRATIAFDLDNMVPGKPGASAATVIMKSEDGILQAYGTAAPSAVAGYAEGCIFHVIDASGGATLYVNEGDATTSDFNLLITEDNISAQSAALLSAANANTVVDTGMPAYGSAAGVGPSPLIWSDAPVLDVMLNPQLGTYYFNDYDKYSGMALADTGDYNDLTYTERTDGLCANLPTVPGGIVQLDSVAVTADQGGTFQHLGLQIEPLTGTTVRMEWRALVDDDAGQCFMGLCDDSITAPVTSSDAITVNDHLGFYRDAGTGSADWTVGSGDGASIEEDDDVCTSVNTTYHKYGLVLEGIGAVTGSTCKFYFDGVLVFTTTDINDLPLLLMCPAFQMDASGSNVIMNIDWLRILVTHATGLCREA